MAIIVLKNKRGGVSFQVKVRDHNGKWFPTPSFDNREAALIEEARLLGLTRKGGKTISEDARIITLSEYWDVWSVENRAKTSEGWRISEDQMWRDYVKPVLGDLKMSDIKTPEIGSCLNSVRKMGRSEQTVKHVYTLLRKLFGDAVDYYEMLASNPVKAKQHRPKVAKTKRDFLLPVQAWHLLRSCAGHYAGPAVWLGVLAGLRSEAVLALDWDSVQWDLGQILIRRAWKAKVARIEDYPKGKDWDYVPMIPQLRKYLRDVWAARGKPKSGFVCLNYDRTKMLPYETYCRVLPKLCREAGVPVMTTHELRHSCTEIWMQAGASAEDIRRLLNHADAATTMNYIHRTDERLAALGERVGTGEMFQNMFQNWNKEADGALEDGAKSLH